MKDELSLLQLFINYVFTPLVVLTITIFGFFYREDRATNRARLATLELEAAEAKMELRLIKQSFATQKIDMDRIEQKQEKIFESIEKLNIQLARLGVLDRRDG